jgi:hypothetical protein
MAGKKATKKPTRMKAQVKITSAHGSPISDADAKKVQPALTRLARKHGGKLTPSKILDAARSPRSPLHRFFDWDDESAAEKYRIQQARVLLKGVRYNVKTKTVEFDVPAWESVRVDECDLPDAEPGKGYVSTALAVNVPSFEEQILENAMRRLRAFRDQYKQYSEVFTTLRPVFNAIDKAEQTVKNKPKKRKKAA